MVEVVLGRRRRMVRMRMVEAEELRSQPAGAALRLPVILRAHQEPPPRPLLGRVRQSEGGDNLAVPAKQGPAAFVGIRLGSMLSNRVGHPGPQVQRHQWSPN